MSAALQTSRRLEYVLLAGTALLYVVATILSHRPDLIWDEGRYLWYARHLTQGFYAPENVPDILNGPGYPLVLAPLVALQVPLMGLRMFNAIFMALATWFSYRAVLACAGRRWALWVALVTALHPIFIRTAPFLMTEALTVCCIAGFAWAFSATIRAQTWNWRLIGAAAFAYAWLTMTRVFFGYVLLVCVAMVVVLMFVWRSRAPLLRRVLAVLAVAFALCLPWLAYTKSVTGETMCWSTNGGELLYWATSTNEGENGHWFSEEDAQNMPELVANHREYYRTHFYLPVKEREAALKQKAMDNIRANPKGVLKNWLCNWGRLAFGFPRSFQHEELLMLVLVAVNGPLLLLWLVTLGVGVRAWHSSSVEVVLLTLLTVVYLGGSSLLPGLPRYTAVLWPWFGYVIASVLSARLRVTWDAAERSGRVEECLEGM